MWNTATSAVDLDTDRAIQEIIRGPLFDDVTILTIAYVVRFGANMRLLTDPCTQTPLEHDHRVDARPGARSGSCGRV